MELIKHTTIGNDQFRNTFKIIVLIFLKNIAYLINFFFFFASWDYKHED